MSDAFNSRTQRSIPGQVCETKVSTPLNHECVGTHLLLLLLLILYTISLCTDCGLVVSENGKNQCLEKWTGNKASSQTCFEEAEFMIKKLKNRKNSSPPPVVNNIVKTPHVSCLASCSCSQCTWIDEHSQKAITFSQRQMHDIETLATRLINGLKSMKDIIKDALLSEAFLSVPSKYTIEEV